MLFDILEANVASGELGITPSDLFFLCQRVGHLPIARINGEDFYGRATVDVVREYLERQKANESRTQNV